MKKNVVPNYPMPNVKDFRELVAYCSDNFADKVAFRWLNSKNEEVTITYKQFSEDVKALGSYFISKGYNRSNIAVVGENSYNWILTYFAVVNSNNVIVPIDKELRAPDMTNLIERSDAVAFVYSDDYNEEAEANSNVTLYNMKNFAEYISEGNRLIAEGDTSYADVVIDRRALSTIIYTSGTTSEPKGVMLCHNNVVSDAIGTAKHFKLPERSMLVLPLHHTYGMLGGVVYPMIFGSSIFINSSMRRLMSDIQFSKPQIVFAVPLMGEMVYKKIWEGAEKNGRAEALKKGLKISKVLMKLGIDKRKKLFSSVHETFGGEFESFVFGGAPIDRSVVRGYHDLGIEPYVGYGTSECSPFVSGGVQDLYSPDSSGLIIDGVEVRIVDGEIQVKGPNVFLGYYKDPEATAEAFDDGWYKTGDLGEVKDDFIYITGRTKNVIVLSNGENVSPEQVEEYIKVNVPEIEEIVVYGRNNALVAEIFKEEITEEEKSRLESKILATNKNAPIYRHISKVVFRDDEFPKTTTKKIIRRAIK